MEDVILLVKRMLREDLCFHDYNITSGKNYSLADIAEIISKISAKRNPVIFENEGLNLEYTGSNERIISQFTNFQFTDISVSLKKVYDFYIQNQSAIDFENVDSRWK